MVTGVDAATALVLIVKVALLLPAGTITLEGTLAAPLLLESITCAPPAGAGPLSVTVPMDDCAPPITLVGFNVSEETAGGVIGVTGSTIVWSLDAGMCAVCYPASVSALMPFRPVIVLVALGTLAAAGTVMLIVRFDPEALVRLAVAVDRL